MHLSFNTYLIWENKKSSFFSNNKQPQIFSTKKMQQEDYTFLDGEDEDRKRFQIELEFVQSLANPNYLNYLAQRGYFKNPTFLNYLKYLMYWKEPEYCKYIIYPQCLSLLEMLQHENFIKEIVNAQCSKYIDEQLLLLWLHYKKRHDWIRIDPTKGAKNVEKLIEHEPSLLAIREDTALDDDAFSVARFMMNEKF